MLDPLFLYPMAIFGLWKCFIKTMFWDKGKNKVCVSRRIYLQLDNSILK